MVTRFPWKRAVATRATSGSQSRSLLGGMRSHQTATAATPAATISAARPGRMATSSTALPSARTAANPPASTRDDGPSNQSAAPAQATPGSRAAASSSLTGRSLRWLHALGTLLRLQGLGVGVVVGRDLIEDLARR